MSSCQGAADIELPFSGEGSNEFSVPQPADSVASQCDPRLGGMRTSWYTFVGSGRNVSVEVRAEFDPYVGIYSGTSCGDQVCVTNTGWASFLTTWYAFDGLRYWIAVGGYSQYSRAQYELIATVSPFEAVWLD